jgi:hypothetical protein
MEGVQKHLPSQIAPRLSGLRLIEFLDRLGRGVVDHGGQDDLHIGV